MIFQLFHMLKFELTYYNRVFHDKIKYYILWQNLLQIFQMWNGA